MNVRWLAVGVLSAVCMARPVSAAEETVAVPSLPSPTATGLVCDRPVFDFGEVRADLAVTNTFILRNAGTGTVSIVNVRPTCGCTTTALATNQLAPGAVAELRATLSLVGRTGHQNKAIFVETNDRLNPRLKLEMTGVIARDIDVQPEGVHFGTLGRDGDAQRDVLLTANSNLTFAIKSVNTGASLFEAEVEAREPGKVYWIHIKAKGPRPAGTTSAIVQVVTDCPTTPSITIPVTVFAAGDVVAVPTQLLLVPSGTNETRLANLTLYSPSGKKFAVKLVESGAPSVQARLGTPVADRVRIEVQTSGSLEDAEGKSIRILTDLDSAREVSVPLHVLRMPAGGKAR